MISSITKLNLRKQRFLLLLSDDTQKARLDCVLSTFFDPEGIEVSVVSDTLSAAQKFWALRPDMMLLNVDRESEKRIKSLITDIREKEGDRHVGIIAIGEGALSCLEAGADDCVAKHFDELELSARIKAALRLKATHDELRAANHQLSILSLTDELTGLANMRCFNQKYSTLFKSCRNDGVGFGIVMLDFDHFKSVNDTTNHLMGSFVLSEFGRLIRQEKYLLASRDIAARFGGDEFILVFVGSSEDVSRKAERIRAILSGHAFERDGIQIRLTASLGVAWVPPHYSETPEEAIKIADMLLYQSKSKGRDCISFSKIQSYTEPSATQDHLFNELTNPTQEKKEKHHKLHII